MCKYQVQTETPPLAKAPSVEKVEQSMQVEISVQDKNVQTSPREEDKPKVKEIVTSIDVAPPVADRLVTDIVQRMPVKIPTETQKTETETITTIEKVTQTTPRRDVEQVTHSTTEPYEINIETSFIIPGDVTATTTSASKPSDSPAVVEIQKTFVIDETQPGNVREIESSTTEKGKKSKSRKNVKRHSGGDKRQDSSDEPIEIKASVGIDEQKSSVPIESLELEQDKQKPTKVTINLTKTTVYDTSNVIGKDVRPSHSSSVRIEEVMSDDNEAELLTPGKCFFIYFFIKFIIKKI